MVVLQSCSSGRSVRIARCLSAAALWHGGERSCRAAGEQARRPGRPSSGGVVAVVVLQSCLSGGRTREALPSGVRLVRARPGKDRPSKSRPLGRFASAIDAVAHVHASRRSPVSDLFPWPNLVHIPTASAKVECESGNLLRYGTNAEPASESHPPTRSAPVWLFGQRDPPPAPQRHLDVHPAGELPANGSDGAADRPAASRLADPIDHRRTAGACRREPYVGGGAAQHSALVNAPRHRACDASATGKQRPFWVALVAHCGHR